MSENLTPKSKRFVLFDLLKIILSFLVVDIHIWVYLNSKNPVFGTYWSYAVPIFMTLSFFFMSKYYFQKKLPFSTVVQRIKRLILPLIFWSAIGFIFNSKLLSLKNIILQLFTGKVVDTPLYYLNLLVLFTIIFWMFTYLPTSILVPLNLLIIFTALFFDYSGISYRFFSPMIDQVRKSYGQIDELIKYASTGLLFGHLIKDKHKNIFLILLITLSIFLLTILKFPKPAGFNYSGLHLFIATILVMSSILLINNFSFSEKIDRLLNQIGGYSFGVYLCHIIFLEKIIKLYPNLRSFNNSFPLIFLLTFTLGCYLFCYLFDTLTFKKLSYLVK